MSQAATMPARVGRTFSPGEFSEALRKAGVIRSERWVQDHCKAGHIRTLPLPGRYLIPAGELSRLCQLEELGA